MINYVDQVSTEQPTLTSYYIFVPYALVVEALLVLLPRYIWAFMINYQTQLDMGEMLVFFNRIKIMLISIKISSS